MHVRNIGEGFIRIHTIKNDLIQYPLLNLLATPKAEFQVRR